MYAETVSEKKHFRFSFALLCGLALCCSVMYFTADASEEVVHEVIKGHDAGSSVGSTDVLKAGQIYTETPDGRMRLMDYFNNVEKKIADEVANRKSDIASVRAQMARDFAFNAAARAKLKHQMMHKMAVNAKKCRDDLNAAMRKTQERFAKQAHLANRRYRATLARDRKTIAIANQNKREEAHNLRMAVKGWQTATAAWAASTNARIDKMNKHVAANAAQIKENAKKARKDLEGAMHSWDHKIANFKRDSKAARSRLSAQFAAQNKATRAWANNKIKALVASTAAQTMRLLVVEVDDLVLDVLPTEATLLPIREPDRCIMHLRLEPVERVTNELQIWPEPFDMHLDGHNHVGASSEAHEG